MSDAYGEISGYSANVSLLNNMAYTQHLRMQRVCEHMREYKRFRLASTRLAVVEYIFVVFKSLNIQLIFAIALGFK